jgi:hypothetical protein
VRAALLLLLLPTAAAAADCAPDLAGARRIAGEGYTLVMRPSPAPIPLARHFALDVAVCPSAGAAAPALARVDARMPEHGHGMSYRTTLTAKGEGRWRADGLMFHMPGRWELLFDLRAGDRTGRLAVEEIVE